VSWKNYRHAKSCKRGGRLALIPLLAVLAACTPPAPQPGATGQPTSTPSATAAATATATPAPSSQPATPPADTDETQPAQAGDKVISSTISQDWGWPGPGALFKVVHQVTPPVAPPPEPPLPYLYSIGAGEHPSGNPAYDQMSFRFKGAFPSYEVEYVPELIQDGSGKTIPMPGTASILRAVFHSAQAHAADGTSSSIVSAPPDSVGYKAITSYAQAGDFEGYVSYGIGVGRPMAAVPQTKVQVYEVEKIEQGQHLYVVALQLDATPWK
jgi:hypothetical protein